MRFLFLVACLTVLSTTLHGAPIKLDTLTVGSQTYQNVTVLGVNATDMYFSHANGMANVKLKHLEKDLQKRLNYDPQAAAEAEKQQVLNDAQFRSALASNLGAKAGYSERGDLPGVGQNPFSDPISERSPVGKRVPALAGLNWSPALPDTSGKYLLLNFHAPWSAVSREALPVVQALHKRSPDKLVLLGIQVGNAGGKSSEPENAFPTVVDSDAKLAALFDVSSVPCVLLVDPSGTLLYRGHPAGIDESKLAKVLAK